MAASIKCDLQWQISISKMSRRPLARKVVDMEYGNAIDSNDGGPAAEIELLAREADMPRAIVAKIYIIERAKLELTARIKTYVPVLTHRRVKALLRQQRHI
jgi:hypothetical protein